MSISTRSNFPIRPRLKASPREPSLRPKANGGAWPWPMSKSSWNSIRQPLQRTFHLLLHAFRPPVAVNDEPYPGVEREVADGPVDEGNHPVPEAHQRHEVHKHPHPPGKETLEPDFSDVDHGFIASNGG